MTSPSRRSAERARALVLALVAASALAACSSKTAPYPMLNPMPEDAAPPPFTGLAGASGGLTGGGGRITGSTGAAGSSGVDAGAPSGAVSIVIQSPMADTMLSANAAADVAAKVTITPGGTDVIDPSTVRVALVPTGGSGAVSAAPLVGPTGDNVFAGKLSLAGLPTGDYTLTVTARSSTNVQGSASVNVTLDGGPKITVLSPLPGGHYKNSLIVQVVIDPGTATPASGITSSIAGTPITLQPTGAPNVYRAVFDLTMPLALTGDQVFQVSAQDSKKTTTDLKFLFNVDVTGPAITMPLPAPGSITAQVIRIAANISDGAGVDASSVQALIGDKTTTLFTIPLTLDSTGAFSALFDTKLLTTCKLPPDPGFCVVRPTISFRAQDALGNDTTLSYEIAIDNFPPISDLVPPDIRTSKIADGLRCSFAFNPLSNKAIAGDAPVDLCRVPQMFDLRARIEDDGNTATGIKQVPIAGVDPDVTAAYVLVDTSQPLVVDNDGDGNCDIINPKLVPTTTPLTSPRQVLKVRLKPVPPAGAADYRPDPTVPLDECMPGTDTDPPFAICGTPDPVVAISYAHGASAIWAIEPIAPDAPGYCFGSQLDTFANNVPDSTTDKVLPGWRCIAIATADLNGNVSTSLPIRVWVDFAYLKDPQNPAPGPSNEFCLKPPASAGPPPSCTGTYNKTTDVVSNKACTARKFQPGEICFNNACD